MSTDFETTMRTALRERADDVAPTPDPWSRTEHAVRRSVRARRAVGAAALALVVLAGVPAVRLVTGLDQMGPATPQQPAEEVVGPRADGDMQTWPARGPLADDPAFLSAMSSAVAEQHGSAQILWAGDIDGTRAVVALTSPDPSDEEPFSTPAGVAVRTLAGPAGASPGAIRSVHVTDYSTELRGVAVALPPLGDPERTQATSFLVLAESGTTSAEVSDAPSFGLDGSVTRQWRRVALRQGLAIERVPPTGAHQVRVRVAGYDGRLLANERPPAQAKGRLPAGLSAEAADLVRDFASTHGVALDAVTVTSARRVRPRADLALDLVVMRLPGGAAFQSMSSTVYLGKDGQGGFGTSRVVDGQPLPADQADTWPVVWRDVDDQGVSGTVYVVAQSGAARARLYAPTVENGPVTRIADIPLDASGFGAHQSKVNSIFYAEGRVEVYDARGARLGSWPLSQPFQDDPLDLD